MQVRGSIPFFWDQLGLTSVEIASTLEEAVPGFNQHFMGLKNDYDGGKVVMLNLISKNKGLEKTLYSHLENVMQNS